MSDENLINALRESINIDEENVITSTEPADFLGDTISFDEIITSSLFEKTVNTIACNPEELILQANQIRKNGVELNNTFLDAFIKVEEMHECWFGKSYVLVLNEFNKLVSDINKLNHLAIEEIPTSLEKIANLFAEADGRPIVKKVTRESYKYVQSLNPVTDEGFRFLSSKVEIKKNEIITDFNEAKKIMMQIIDCLRNISWNDDTAQQFTNSLRIFSKKMSADFDEVIKKINVYIQGQVDAVSKVENANMF